MAKMTTGRNSSDIAEAATRPPHIDVAIDFIRAYDGEDFEPLHLTMEALANDAGIAALCDGLNGAGNDIERGRFLTALVLLVEEDGHYLTWTPQQHALVRHTAGKYYGNESYDSELVGRAAEHILKGIKRGIEE